MKNAASSSVPHSASEVRARKHVRACGDGQWTGDAGKRSVVRRRTACSSVGWHGAAAMRCRSQVVGVCACVRRESGHLFAVRLLLALAEAIRATLFDGRAQSPLRRDRHARLLSRLCDRCLLRSLLLLRKIEGKLRVGLQEAAALLSDLRRRLLILPEARRARERMRT